MSHNRKTIAAVLEEISRLLEVKGENPFKCRAFSQAARVIGRSDLDLDELAASGQLTSIRGIGKSTATEIESLLQNGSSPLLTELRAAFPEGLRRVMEIPGLGPKRVRVISEELGVGSLAELEYAIHENRLRDLQGFGEKSQDNLLREIVTMRRNEGLFLVTAGWKAAAEILATGDFQERRIEIAGTMRRQLETLSEVLLISETAASQPASDKELKASVGVPVRILYRPAEIFEAAWLWESCSEEHRASLQSAAETRGLQFDEDGLRKGNEILSLDEDGIYKALGFEPVHPLLREGDAAHAQHPAALAGPESIRGVFHAHTTDSDGVASVEEMVREAERLGYLWIGISDHSQAAFYANGLSPDRLRAQRETIAEVQNSHPGIRILHGIESDILTDGSLDYKDDELAELDFVIASIHSQMRQDGATMTKRIERALRHPATTHWGHPTGRLLLGREGYACDVDHLLNVCAEEGVSVEFNANPHRLDLDWRWIGRARELGVPVSVNPDAHSPAGLSDARLTVGTAAKGGLTPDEVLNNKSGVEISEWLQNRKS